MMTMIEALQGLNGGGKERWVSARFGHGAGENRVIVGPHLGTFDGKNFYWMGGPSYMPIPDDFKIVKEYPVAPDEDPEACHFGKLSASSERSRRDAIDRIEIEFYRDNPLTPSEFTGETQWNPVEGKNTVAIEGWLSPGGDYYPHEYGRHNQVAEHLAAQIFGDLRGKVCLEERGWASVHHNGIVDWKRKHEQGCTLTIQQVRFIREMILKISDDEILFWLKPYVEEECVGVE